MVVQIIRVLTSIRQRDRPASSMGLILSRSFGSLLMATHALMILPAPEEGWSGRHVANVILRIVCPESLPWVAACDVDLTGSVRNALGVAAKELRVFQASDLLHALPASDQVVWASWFFFSAAKDAETIRPHESYVESARKSELVVRVVDAGYVYVAGPVGLAQSWRSSFQNATIEVVDLSESHFPE